MSKNLKSILFTVLMLIFLVVAILGWVWTDVARTPFWWNFWEVAAVVSGLGFIGGIWWYVTTKQQN